MELHIPTLALVAVFVTAILGLLLLLAWRRDQSTDALAWWGVGYLVGGMAFALLSARNAIPDVLSIEMAVTLLLLSYSFLLAGTRAFNGRHTPVTLFLIAPLIWLTAMRVPSVAENINLRIIVISNLQVVFVALTGYELWRERAEPLLSRWPAIVLLVSQVGVLAVRVMVVVLTPIATRQDFFRSSAFGMMTFATVLYTITFAFLLLSMTKERTELRHKMAALIDPLTGLANRRAFLDDAEAVAVRRAESTTPMTVLLADLDRFKAINDRFGHAVGDRVLQVFADTIAGTLRAKDLSGRLGGEEFAFLMPGTKPEDAVQIAERIRQRFSDTARIVDGHAVASTVSIGVATTAAAGADVKDLLGVADQALYRAKAEGRNRVCVIDFDGASGDAPSIAPEPPAFALSRRILSAA